MDIPEDLKAALAEHNKKGNASAIDFAAYYVRPARMFFPLSKLDEAGGIDGCVKSIVDAARLFHQEKKTGLEILGYEVATGEHKDHGPIIAIVVYAGRPFSEDERHINDTLRKIDQSKGMDWQTMMNQVKAILPAEAFDKFRAVLSRSGMDKKTWNSVYAPDKLKPKPYTGSMKGGFFNPGGGR